MLTEYKEKMVNKMSLLSTEGLSSLLAGLFRWGSQSRVM